MEVKPNPVSACSGTSERVIDASYAADLDADHGISLS
jgi:hypothetical protein